MIYNTRSQYGSVAKFVHWLVFLLILTLILVGFFWQNTGTNKYTVINIHKLIGLLTFTIIIFRLFWISIDPKPVIPSVKPWEKITEHTVHGLIYVCLLTMPLSGWTMSTAAGKPPHLFTQLFPMPGIAKNEAIAKIAATVHLVTAWTLIGLVSLHILAALKHHFINKDNVLKRMLPDSWTKAQ